MYKKLFLVLISLLFLVGCYDPTIAKQEISKELGANEIYKIETSNNQYLAKAKDQNIWFIKVDCDGKIIAKYIIFETESCVERE